MTRTNVARAEAGLPPLEPDESLTRIARAHATEMAALEYFSHSSPIATNATLSRRAANAGSFARNLGENLALASATDTASRATKGWLGSPGHRANLLSPEFTHVGFGTARYPDGRIVIAQEFALEPAVLTRASLSALAKPQLDVLLTLNEPAEVAVFFAGTSSTPVALSPGQQLLHVPLSRAPALPLSLKLGLRPLRAGGSMRLQSEGTLAPEGWLPGGPLPDAQARIDSAGLVTTDRTGYRVQITFASEPRFALTAWQGGTRIPGELSGTTLTLELESDRYPLHLGVPQADARYRILYSFMPSFTSPPTLMPLDE